MNVPIGNFYNFQNFTPSGGVSEYVFKKNVDAKTRQRLKIDAEKLRSLLLSYVSVSPEVVEEFNRYSFLSIFWWIFESICNLNSLLIDG